MLNRRTNVVRRSRFIPLASIIALHACVASGVAAARNDPPTSPHLGSDARAIFAVKCIQCHGSTLSHPKGKFGYVLDLRQVARNPDLVVPFNPAESKLWQQIEDDDMPPEGAKAGPLSDPEKAVIRW